VCCHVADRLGVPFFTWTRSQGLSRSDLGDMIYESPDSKKAIQHVIAAQQDGVYHFRSFAHTLTGNDLLISLVRDAARSLERLKAVLVLTGEDVELPGPLSGDAPRRQ
jgi:hypothetical protein